MSTDWGRTVVDVVDGWLFADHAPDVGNLPTSLVVPLENPHLHDDAAWRETFGPPVRSLGLVDVHAVGTAEIAVARPVLGAASAAMLVDAASRRGVRRVVGVGFCGGTAPELVCGDVVVVEAAISGDGVSDAYLPGTQSVSSSPGLLALVPPEVHRGVVRSVPAVHLETQALVDECAAAGVAGIDLESAAVLAVATVRDFDAVTVLAVSDHPGRGEAADGVALADGHRAARELARAVALAADL